MAVGAAADGSAPVIGTWRGQPVYGWRWLKVAAEGGGPFARTPTRRPQVRVARGWVDVASWREVEVTT